MEYRALRISDILRDINRDYFLPDIQREFVWSAWQIEKLFDSIMNDYPIASFLFWKVLSENKNDWNSYEFIKNFDKEKPHNEPAEIRGNRDIYLILDGQQRITSFYIGLKGSYRYHYYKWRKVRLYLNLLKSRVPNEDDPEELTYQFKFLEDTDVHTNDAEFLWYRVGRILDFIDSEYAKSDIKSEISHLNEDLQENAKILIGQLHTRIHTIPVINYHEETSQDYDKVLNIFVRTNSEGKRLEYSDLLLSTATAKWDKLNAREEINIFTDAINNITFGYNFGKDFVLKGSLYLTDNLPIQYKVNNFNRPNLLAIEKNWDNIKTYVETTIRLISKYGFHSKNIPSHLPLLPIAFFLMKRGNANFHKSYKNIDVKLQVVIRRWIIFSLLKRAFSSSSDTKLKYIRDIFASLSDFDVFPIEKLNQKLDVEDKFSDTEIESLSTLTYKSRYSYLILSLLYPDRDWKDTIFHEDHIFPKSEFQIGNLRKHGYDEEKINRYLSYYNTVPNLQLLTDSENLKKYSTSFDLWISTQDESFKNRHLIPYLDSYDLDNFENFIIERKAKMIEMLKAV